jgi:hypothetical protein
MTQTKVRIPRISLRQVARYLDNCVRPVPDDPSKLEIRPEKVPPLFRLSLFPKKAGRNRLTADEPRFVNRDEWSTMADYRLDLAYDVIWRAEEFAQADRGPSASDLEEALLADPWVAGRNSSGDLCLIGFRPCGRAGKSTKAFSYQLRALNVEQGWALAGHWYRLGQRISGPEFQKLRPRYSNLQEFTDEEIEASLQADRARLASKMRDLKPPPQPLRSQGADKPSG